MLRALLLFMAAALAGIAQASFVRALPAPYSSLQLPLILIVGLVTVFRAREAFAAAFIAGLTLDALSSLPTGTETAVLLAVTVCTVLLFNRIFTHHSWVGTVGLNAAIFSLQHLAYVIVDLLRSVFTGIPYSLLPTAASFWAFLSALGTQTAFVLLLLAVNGGIRRAFVKRFVLLR